MGTQVLVPTDGSDHAERAVDHAIEMVAGTDGALHLLHVVDTERYGEPALSSTELVVTQQEDAGSRLLKRLAGTAGQRDVPTTRERCHGDPLSSILERVETEGVDVVVMARQGFAQERSMRDVATGVLQRSDAEVVLV